MVPSASCWVLKCPLPGELRLLAVLEGAPPAAPSGWVCTELRPRKCNVQSQAARSMKVTSEQISRRLRVDAEVQRLTACGRDEREDSVRPTRSRGLSHPESARQLIAWASGACSVRSVPSKFQLTQAFTRSVERRLYPFGTRTRASRVIKSPSEPLTRKQHRLQTRARAFLGGSASTRASTFARTQNPKFCLLQGVSQLPAKCARSARSISSCGAHHLLGILLPDYEGSQRLTRRYLHAMARAAQLVADGTPSISDGHPVSSA